MGAVVGQSRHQVQDSVAESPAEPSPDGGSRAENHRGQKEPRAKVRLRAAAPLCCLSPMTIPMLCYYNGSKFTLLCPDRKESCGRYAEVSVLIHECPCFAGNRTPEKFNLIRRSAGQHRTDWRCQIAQKLDVLLG